MRRKLFIGIAVTVLGMSLSACVIKKEADGPPSSAVSATETTESAESSEPMSQEKTAADETIYEAWEVPESLARTWQLDTEKTKEHLKNHRSLPEMFGTVLGAYSSSLEIGMDGSVRCFIGTGFGGAGQSAADGDVIRISITPFEDSQGGNELLQLRTVEEQGAEYLIMKYDGEDLYWEPDPDIDSFFVKDGITYEKVRDLTNGLYHWASAVTKGDTVLDDHGHETSDYSSQKRSYVSLDDEREIGVRRFDNLLYTAGDYLIYEYDGTGHVSKSDDLYHPILNVKANVSMITKLSDGYMIPGETIFFYDEDFRPVREVEGYRATESSILYQDGRLAVRDMKTGLMGFMDETGDIVIPCEYGSVSEFSNGFASVLVGADLIPYTEDSGTVAMFDAEGGQWGIIDTHGTFILEPSGRFANLEAKRSKCGLVLRSEAIFPG